MSCNCKEGNIYNIGMGCCRPSIMPADDFYTKPQIDEMIEEIKESGCCITEEEVDEKIESAKTEIEAEIPSLSGYATEQWVENQGYITGVDLSNYATKDEIPVVPTSNTAFTNDAGYLTEHQSLSAYSTTDEVNSAITQATSGLQQTLSAGTNVQIQSNVISATDTKYTAGDNITISNQNVISTVTKFWCGTEAQWAQISGNTDANTIYLIH